MVYIFWTLYLLGWLLHTWSQAQASVHSGSNSLTTVRQWAHINAHVLVVRLFLGCMSMLLWTEAPNLFGELVGRSLPQTRATCGIMGFAVDAVWDKVTFILGLKVEVPQIAPPSSEDKHA